MIRKPEDWGDERLGVLRSVEVAVIVGARLVVSQCDQHQALMLSLSTEERSTGHVKLQYLFKGLTHPHSCAYVFSSRLVPVSFKTIFLFTIARSTSNWTCGIYHTVVRTSATCLYLVHRGV